MFFSNFFAFLFSVFWKYKLYNYFLVWRRDLNTGLFDIWQLCCITHFWRIWWVLKRTRWNEMRCDEMISSCHRSDHQVDILIRWRMKLWTQKKWTDASWSGRGVQEEVWAFFCSGWRGRGYCCCCCIKWMKRKMILPLLLLYKRSGRGVQEEVLAFFCSGRRGRGGGGLSTSRLWLEGRGRRHGRKLLTADKHTPQQFEAEAKARYILFSHDVHKSTTAYSTRLHEMKWMRDLSDSQETQPFIPPIM